MKSTPQTRTLDKWFSRYIRLRDTQIHGPVCNFGYCCTCGEPIRFESCDCGHFLSREYTATRWDERNAHAQCRSCNRFKSGKQYEHSLHVAKVHGEQVPDLLLWKSKHPAKFTNQEIKDMIEVYKAKCKELE